MARVYISSTYEDLKQERQLVMDWLVRLDHQPVHSYSPNSENVRDSCLKDVETCDIYVLILGHRYGFQPPKDNPDTLSITQLEYRQAGFGKLPRIALVRTSIPDVRQTDFKDPVLSQRVEAFRNEVANDVRTWEFHDSTSLLLGLMVGMQEFTVSLLSGQIEDLKSKIADKDRVIGERDRTIGDVV